MIRFTGNVGDFLKIGVAAAGRGDIESVRQILKARPGWIHHVGSHGRTMLWEACHRGKLPMVKYLVRRKANIDAFGSHYTPHFVDISCYCIARFKKHDDVADYLLDKGARLNIHTAAYLGNLDQVKCYVRTDSELIDAGHPQHVMAEKNCEGIEFVAEAAVWATPLCYALRGGNVDTVKWLIGKRSRIKGIEDKLFIAANDDPVLIEMLFECRRRSTRRAGRVAGQQQTGKCDRQIWKTNLQRPFSMKNWFIFAGVIAVATRTR